MKILKKALFICILICVFLTAFYVFWLSPRYTVPILMYHHFGSNESSLFVTPENFDRQMSYLKNKGYEIISLNELVEGIKNNKKFRHNTVVITIDDGYKDNYIHAYPVLKKYGLPTTIFIVGNFIGKRPDFMSWGEVKEMSRNNISFGAHTKNEIYVPSIKEEAVLRDETFGCKKLIEAKIDVPVNYFCYPTGGFTEQAKTVLKKVGFKGACTTNRGFAELNKDIYELKRIKIKNSDTNKPLSFWAKLSGYYNVFRAKKSGH